MFRISKILANNIGSEAISIKVLWG